MSNDLNKVSQSSKFDIHLLLVNYQNRKKFFWFSESFDLLNNQFDPNPSVIDPMLAYTQSGKNYTEESDHLLLENYFDPEFFKVKQSAYGYTNRFVEIQTNPVWANQIFNNFWYWRQKKALDLSKWLYIFPGVKNVFISGSAALEICREYSDIDFTVQANKGSLLIARFWCLAFFKLNNWNYHRSLKKEIPNIFRHPPLGRVRTDFGLIYEKESDFSDYFSHEERLLPIINKILLTSPLSTTKDLINTQDNTLNFLSTGAAYKTIAYGIRYFLWIISLAIYPILSLQVFWYKIRKKNQYPQEYVSRDFCCFYPNHYILRKRQGNSR